MDLIELAFFSDNVKVITVFYQNLLSKEPVVEGQLIELNEKPNDI